MGEYKKGKRSHSKEVVTSAADALMSAQKMDRQTLTSKEAVLSIKKNVLSARARGMTWEEIAEVVKGAGLTVGISTLKKFVGPSSKPVPTPAAAVVPKVASPASAGKVGDRIRAERAASPAPAPAVAPAVPGAAPSTTQVKMDGRGGFAITPMIDDI